MRATVRIFLFALASFPLSPLAAAQSAAAPAASRDADLQLVVVLSRHGVRAPMGKSALYGQYAAAPWPEWDVPPSYLTAHGYQLMKLFGAWDRTQFASQNLFAPTGCADAAHVTILADSDQRTRETGKALAEGMFPGCEIAVHAQPEDTNDPLFSPIESGAVHPDAALASAAVAGRIGGNINNVNEAYRSQLTLLDRVLAGCGHAPANATRTSIFDVPNAHNLVATAASISENLLLEYTQGMSQADTGWGCLDGATLRTIMQVNSAHWDYGFRTPAVARAYASTLLDRILKTMEQSATGAAVPGAIGKPGDRLVILVGHDTNLVTAAGALNIDWVFDGRVDDTPPGGALLFELWHPRDGGKPFVRLEYVAQTLEQMRNSEALTPRNPPAVAPIFVPGCSRQDLSCTWEGFSATVRAQYADKTTLRLIQGALRLSSHVILKDPSQFASQAMGRLFPLRDPPRIRRFLSSLAGAAPHPWLRLLHSALHPPGTALVRTLEGHSDQVSCVAVSLDVRRAVSGSGDKTLKVWDLETGSELYTLLGHSNYVAGVALTPDGKCVVSASHDRTLKVWDLETGRELRTLEGHSDWVDGIVIAPDGKCAVSASRDKTLKVWDLGTGSERRTMQGHSHPVLGVAICPDGRRVASASADHTLKVWDLVTGHELRTLTGHTSWVSAVAISPDGRLAVSASWDKTLKVWDLETGRALLTLDRHTSKVYGVAVSPDGRLVVSASEDKSLKVWSLESGREIRTLQAIQHGSGEWRRVRLENGRFPPLGTRPLRYGIWNPVASWADWKVTPRVWLCTTVRNKPIRK